MRWVPSAVLPFAALSMLGAAPVPKHLMKDEPYWPTAVGTKWVYQQGEREATEEITKAEAIRGGTRLTISTDTEQEDVVEVTPSGMTARTAGKCTLDVLMVRFPLKAGDSWEVVYPTQPGISGVGGKKTVGETEELSVPAGKFRVTKVVFTVTEVSGKPVTEPFTYTYWYAKGVGLVRVDWPGGGRVLKSFTPGK